MKEQFTSNLNKYFSYIARDIGTPPDTLKAKILCDKYLIVVRYESDSTIWQYGNFNSFLSNGQRHLMRFAIGFMKEDPYIIYNSDGSRFLFGSDFHKIINPNPYEFLIIIFFILIIFSLNYLAIRKILKPIKHLTTGVDELSKGNLDHKIPLTGNNELTLLSGSFNNMTGKIKEMMHARERLLLDVSHELRSPLTRIKLALEFIKEEKRKDSISADVHEIEIMITEILESERLKDEYGKLKLASFNLPELLEEIIEDYWGIKPGIVIQKIPNEYILCIDKERIKLVFKNILDNAIKYSHTQSKQIILTAEELPDGILINIKDDGFGIPDEDLPFVFEPFYRVDKSRTRKTGGYGLGLSLCKNIIEAHGGEISIRNNHDRGTTVSIKLNK
jgi:signal transduction histidine kinase